MKTIRYELADGIATLTFDEPGSAVNTMCVQWQDDLNEAFAAVPMKFMKEMGVPHEKVNVNGGAIAMGHPLGATGAMILNTLVDELHRRKLRYGLATLCVGGGMGIATIVERI